MLTEILKIHQIDYIHDILGPRALGLVDMSKLLDMLGSAIMSYTETKHQRGEQQLISWTEQVTASALLDGLDKGLQPLLNDTVGYVGAIYHKFAVIQDGTAFWTFNSFDRFIAARNLLHDKNYVKLLWQIFVRAAYHPFLPRLGTSGIKSVRIQLVEFRRAFTFLVLHGWDLIGDGILSPNIDPRALGEVTAFDKAPRIARILYNCIASETSPGNQDNGPSDHANIKDLLMYIQPPVYRNMCIMPKDLDPCFDAAAARLLLEHTSGFDQKQRSRTVRKADLQTLIEMLLLLRPTGERWKAGYSTKHQYGISQHAGDVQHAHFDDNREAMFSVKNHASALLEHEFPGADDIPIEAFQTWAVQNPFFIYSFFMLWSAIFAPGPRNNSSSDTRENIGIPSSTANMLCLTGAAHFLSPHINYRWHSDEHQVQQDLQQSQLLFDTSNADQDPKKLCGILLSQDWFHVLLFTCTKAKSSAADKSSIYAAFISPWLEPPARKEMEREDRHVQYVWSTSLVQLRPNVLTWRCGGLTASTDDGMLRLTSQGSVGGQRVALAVDSDVRELQISTPGTSATHSKEDTQQSEEACYRLSRFQCYRLPRKATHITFASHPPELPWMEQTASQSS